MNEIKKQVCFLGQFFDYDLKTIHSPEIIDSHIFEEYLFVCSSNEYYINGVLYKEETEFYFFIKKIKDK